MKFIPPIIVGLLVAGLEPFWPLGSPAIALAAVLGTKYPNSRGLIAAILIGLVRDVLLVNRLGTSSLVTAFAWFIAAVSITRLGRPVVTSILAALAADLPAKALAAAGALAQAAASASYQFIFSTAALAGIFSAIWNFISDRDESIRIRKN